MEMDNYHLVMYRRGPNWTAHLTPELERIGREHVNYQMALRRAEKAATVGLFTNTDLSGSLRSMSILRTDSFDEARIIAESDPAVQAGLLAVEVHAIAVPRGAFD